MPFKPQGESPHLTLRGTIEADGTGFTEVEVEKVPKNIRVKRCRAARLDGSATSLDLRVAEIPNPGLLDIILLYEDVPIHQEILDSQEYLDVQIPVTQSGNTRESIYVAANANAAGTIEFRIDIEVI